MKIYNSAISILKSSLDYSKLQRLDFLNIDAEKFLRDTKQFDVCYFHKFPFNILCNFSPANFKFENIDIASMEGFIQALKTPDKEVQKQICQTFAPTAKKIGKYYKKIGFFDRKNLYWQGKCFDRESTEYKKLLESVYEAKYKSDSEYREILQATNGYKLTHKIGKTNHLDTVLTEDEFMEQLNILRMRFNDKNKILSIPQIIQNHKIRNTICNSLKDLEKLSIEDLHLLDSKTVVGPQITKGNYKKHLLNIKNSGIKTVLDLSSNANIEEQTSLCQKYGLKYINIPINEILNRTNKSAIDKHIKKLCSVINKDKTYIEFAHNIDEANYLLALNYLANPNAYIGNAALVDDACKNPIFVQNMIKLIKLAKIDSDKSVSQKFQVLIDMNKW